MGRGLGTYSWLSTGKEPFCQTCPSAICCKILPFGGQPVRKQQQKLQFEVFFELDWIINDNTVVRSDGMIVCGNFIDDFLNFPPTLILEVSSDSTRMKDRNTKYTLYEMYGVKYYIIAGTEKTSIEVFELTDNKYKQKQPILCSRKIAA